MTTHSPAFFRDLEQTLPSQVSTGAQAQSALKKAVFNGSLLPQAIALATCHSEHCVQKAVQVAARHQVPVSVLAGGHDFSGRGLTGDSLVLDLRSMSQVAILPDPSQAVLQGGCLASHLLDALPDDIATVTGTVRSVGVAGFTLGGGYGKLNSRFGLGADCLAAARVVTANGEAVTANQDQNPDLFWALRGGGSGFGVVTSLTLNLHCVGPVLSAMILVTLDGAKHALLHVEHLLALHPIQLSIFSGLVTIPGQGPVLFLAPLWTGDSITGHNILHQLQKLPGATLAAHGWQPYKSTFHDEQDQQAHPAGHHYTLRTHAVSSLTAHLLDTLIGAAQQFPTPFCAILFHDFHGAATSIPPAATAFPLRSNHILVEVIAAWPPAAANASSAYQQWLQQLCQQLTPAALPGSYIALTPPPHHQQVQQFFGPSAQKLLHIKQLYDPGDLFRSGIGRLTPAQPLTAKE